MYFSFVYKNIHFKYTVFGCICKINNYDILVGRCSPENGEKAPLKPIQKQELYDEYPTNHQVTADTPKTFLVCAYDDPKVPMDNSLRFASSLKQVGVDAEVHVFMKGNHGFAIRNAKGPIAEWTNLVLENI